MSKDTIQIIVGAAIGFIPSLLIVIFREIIIYAKVKHNRKQMARDLLPGLLTEIQEAITRCEGYVDFLSDGKVSYSRIYTGLFDSIKNEIPHLFDTSTLILIHKIYYRFELINSNMDKGDSNNPEPLANGQAFAKEYIREIIANYEKLGLTNPL